MRNAECGITREHNPKPKIILRVFNEGFMRNDRLKAFLYRQISFSRSPNSEFRIPNSELTCCSFPHSDILYKEVPHASGH